MRKVLKIGIVSFVAVLFFSLTAFADATFSSCWVQDSSGNWKVQYPNGSFVKDAWFCDDAVASNGKDVWYLLDSNGNMISAALVQDGTGNYYSIEINHNGYYGMLRYKSGNYDGIYLELESSHAGSFAAIKNADGIAALKAKYGLVNVNINNSNCVYSTSIVGTTGRTVSSASQSNTYSSSSSSNVSSITSKASDKPDRATIARLAADVLAENNEEEDMYFSAEGGIVYMDNYAADKYDISDADIIKACKQTWESTYYTELYSGFRKRIDAEYGENLIFFLRVYNHGRVVYQHIY